MILVQFCEGGGVTFSIMKTFKINLEGISVLEDASL